MYAGTFDPRRCALTRSLPGATTRGAQRPRFAGCHCQSVAKSEVRARANSASGGVRTPIEIVSDEAASGRGRLKRGFSRTISPSMGCSSEPSP